MRPSAILISATSLAFASVLGPAQRISAQMASERDPAPSPAVDAPADLFTACPTQEMCEQGEKHLRAYVPGFCEMEPGMHCIQGSRHCGIPPARARQVLRDSVRATLANSRFAIIYDDATPTTILEVAKASGAAAGYRAFYRVRIEFRNLSTADAIGFVGPVGEPQLACDIFLTAHRVSIPDADARPSRWQVENDAFTEQLMAGVDRALNDAGRQIYMQNRTPRTPGMRF